MFKYMHVYNWVGTLLSLSDFEGSIDANNYHNRNIELIGKIKSIVGTC